MDFSGKSSVFWATGAYIGKIPWAPGTFGTLWGIPLAFALSLAPWPVAVLLVAGFSIFAVWAADEAERILGGKDPGSIVIDEVAGYLVTVLALPFTLKTVAAGFVFFRIMDIAKPPPVRQADQRLSGGLGIVADDVLAGVYAHIATRIFLAIF